MFSHQLAETLWEPHVDITIHICLWVS